jgi:hypothetical protein
VPSVDETVRLYQELATLSDCQGQPQMHDRFLVLAADAALTAGRADEAERLRQRLLQRNPHHLLKPYGSLAEAMRAPDIVSYVVALRRSHPYEAALQLRDSLRKDGGEPEDPPEGATLLGQGADWSVDMDELNAPEALKLYKAQDTAEVPRPAQDAKPPPAKKAKTNAPEPPRPKPTAAPSPYPVLKAVDPPADDVAVPPTMQVPKPRGVPPPPATPERGARQVASPFVRPKTVAPPAPIRDVYTLQPDPAPMPRRPPAHDDEETEHGGAYWVSTALAVLLFIAGVALTVYTFARPFLPHT